MTELDYTNTATRIFNKAVKDFMDMEVKLAKLLEVELNHENPSEEERVNKQIEDYRATLGDIGTIILYIFFDLFK